MKFNWQNYFKDKFKEIGDYIRANNMRVSMHHRQYTLINSKDNEIVKRSISELIYHVDVLDLMELDETAKVQIHVGGVYREKESSLIRFIKNYNKLNPRIIKRLVIENDDKNYTLKDCLQISKEINIPIVFDVYHHKFLNSGESVQEAFKNFTNTWKEKDGIPIVDYSSEHPNKKKYSHADQINIAHFKTFLNQTNCFDYDLMLEIKDKERSALRALETVVKDPRLNINH
jgi:UV DNA damage endonuclease